MAETAANEASHGADDPRGHSEVLAERVADGDGELARAEGAAIAQGDGDQGIRGSVDLQHRNV